MLLSFRFANHRSFRTEQQLNLTPLYRAVGEDRGQPTAVRVVGVFGANASGKSNCLQALGFMRNFATRSDREVEPGLGLTREPFRLDPDALEEPSSFAVDLLLGGIRHTYGFTISDDRVTEEWLYHYPLNRQRRVFERDRDDFTWGEQTRRRSDLERIADITAPTALFLSTVARFAGRSQPTEDPEAQPMHSVYRWFFRARTRSGPFRRHPNMVARRWPDEVDAQGVLIGLLRAADVGITDVQLIEEEPPEAALFEVSEPRLVAHVRPRSQRRLVFAHHGPRGNALLGLEDESTGTQQLLDLAIDAAAVLHGGGMMTVDEIDASLHPMLTAKLIGLFQNPATNPRHSQLVFTSHDATLLGTFDTEEILARDEIWFTEKDDDGASTLYPLSDFKPRKEGENRQRRYLNGNYGAVPDMSTLLFEQALASRKESGARKKQ
ncbi:AAA family ATPase [Polymorphospora rubra]|uniref:AAA family ATPase n=1 Tax=Polymorphospora rubra TaxID=338584 RepID=UPI0033DDEAB7